MNQAGADAEIVVEGASTFRGLIEGINSGSEATWKIRTNSFDTIYDHAIYLTGALQPFCMSDACKSEITGNNLSKIGYEAIKLGGPHPGPPDGSDPRAGPFFLGAYKARITLNSFSCLRRGGIFMSGVENTVDVNTVAPYNAAVCGAAYNPAPQNYPELWITTDGGQGEYYNHGAWNTVTNNSKGPDDAFIIFIDQRPDPAVPESDRSIECNTVTDSTSIPFRQHVYFRHLRPERTIYQAKITVNGPPLTFSYPPGCSSCQGLRPDSDYVSSALPCPP